MNSVWMIYGANGYTGNLIAREAAKQGLRPVLAGRAPEVAALARELGLEHRIFALGADAAETARQLQGVAVVLHCAGPFSATSKAMLDACLVARAHYLDITGEIEVFESVFARAEELKRGGIAALPGAGFDVVPTDCLAAMLKRKLPDAIRLTMAFRSDGKISPGTAKSMVEGVALGGRVRQGGKLVTIPIAARSREIDLRGDGKLSHAIIAPWGDVATAYHSTGIPDIEFYIAAPPGSERMMRFAARLMRSSLLRSLTKRLIASALSGPDSSERASLRSWIWGEVVNAAGKSATMRMELPEGYQFTVHSALACVRRVVAGELSPGAWTPSMAFGPDFALSIEGVKPPVLLPPFQS